MKQQQLLSSGLAWSIIFAVAHCPFTSDAAQIRWANPPAANSSSLANLPGHSTSEPPPLFPPRAAEVQTNEPVDSDTGGPPGIEDFEKVVSIAPDVRSFSVPVETCIALIWITMVAMLPAVVIKLEGGAITRTQLTLFAVMWLVFFAGIYLFTNVLLFQSAHFKDIRPLTIVEAVYFMSQILTTVGYGDITPAKPRGQVFVAFYVLFSLLTLANVVSEVFDIVTERSKRLAIELIKKQGHHPEDGSAVPDSQQQARGKPSPRLFRRSVVAPELNVRSLLAALAAYIFFAIVGTMFFRLCPGEGKTVLQGVYMSVITLSTVGFGAFTPVTEYGQVFGAFWMLFGSAALVGVIGGFSELMTQMKLLERWHACNPQDEVDEFLSGVPDQMNQYEFLKQVLIHRELVNEGDLTRLSEFFDGQCGTNGFVTKGKLEDAVGRLALPSVFSAQ